MKETVARVFSDRSANNNPFGISREVAASDVPVEVIDLLGNTV